MGPMDSIERSFRFRDQLDCDVELIPYAALSLKDSAARIVSCQQRTDGVLFTGRSAYDSTLVSSDSSQCRSYVPHNETVLFGVMANYNLNDYDFVSVDLLDQKMVDKVFASRCAPPAAF